MTARGSTIDRLLGAVDQVVFVEGLTSASVDTILERAGASPATLYRAFASKEALIAAALDRRHVEWMEVWDAALERASTDRDRLLSVFDALEDFHARPSGARWCAFLGTAAAHAEADPVLAAAVGQETEALRSRLGELARPVVGETAAPGLVEQLLLLYSGRLAMRLRPEAPGVRLPSARAMAELVVDDAVRGTP